jgi:polyhydroxyalkanoate synthesis regulator phasin
MGLRSQLTWLRNSQAASQSLEQRVTAIEEQLATLNKELSLLRDRQLDEFDKVRAAVAGATDDLVARVDALRKQVDKS